MDLVVWVTIIGTVASLSGAGVSIWQASRARSSANEAERVRSQLVDQRKASELSQIQTVCKKALRAMEKYGPGSVPSSLKGVSPGSDATMVQEVLVLLREHRAHFGAREPNDADDFCSILEPLLDEFARSRGMNTMRTNGTPILAHLSTFLAVVKRQLELKREMA